MPDVLQACRDYLIAQAVVRDPRTVGDEPPLWVEEDMGISDAALQTLLQHDWPGNVRELEHVIERHFILAEGEQINTIDIPVNQLPVLAAEEKLETMEEMERTHILKVLKACNGRVSGSMGAAAILCISAQTLYSKMKKLGIKTTYK